MIQDVRRILQGFHGEGAELQRTYLATVRHLVPEDALEANQEPFMHFVFQKLREESVAPERDMRTDWPRLIREFETARRAQFLAMFYERSPGVFVDGGAELPSISDANILEWLGQYLTEQNYGVWLKTPYLCCHLEAPCRPCDGHWRRRVGWRPAGGSWRRSFSRMASAALRTLRSAS